MNVFDFVSPDSIKTSYAELRRHIDSKGEREEEKLKLQQQIDDQSIAIMAEVDEAGKPVINGKTIEERKRQIRARLPELYKKMDEAERNLRMYTTLISLDREEIHEAELLVAMFNTREFEVH